MTYEPLARNRHDDAPPLGELYDVGGRRILLHHAGTGTPAVVIEAGAGAFGCDYLSILQRCAQRTTCVVYDRAGSGWSDPDPGPRGADEIVIDLREALRQAGIGGPYIVVGHSLGGLLVRAFAQKYPSDVAGLVLIDPLVEGIPLPEASDDAVVATMLAEMRRNPDILRTWYPDLFAEWEKLPVQARDPLIARHSDPDFAMAGIRDMQNARRIQDDVTNGPALPDVPVTVLTGMAIDRSPGMSDEEKRAFNQVKLEAHAAFAGSLPRAEHRVFADADHLFFARRPELVVNAVFDILGRVA